MNTMLEPRIVAARVHRRCALPHFVVGALRVVTTASSHGGLTRFIYASSLTQPARQKKKNAAHFRERRSHLFEVNVGSGRYHHPTRAAHVGTPVRSRY